MSIIYRSTMESSLPACAARREQRTVCTRLREDLCEVVGPCPCLRAVREGCPGCREERKDCASVLVPRRKRLGRCRATCAGWRKCISVTAAFCFVFIVGGLCPGGVAAPVSREGSPTGARMERTKRSDLPIWRNPCRMAINADENGTGQGSINKTAAKKMQISVINVRENATDYKEPLAQMTQSRPFNDALARNGGLQGPLQPSWYQLPNKNLGDRLEDSSYFEYAKTNLPAMYKYLELAMGAMATISTTAKNSDKSDPILRQNLNGTLDKMKMLLCEFDIFLLEAGIRKLKSLEMDEVPPRPNQDSEGGLNDFLVYRDTLNFLEIMEAVFGEMS